MEEGKKKIQSDSAPLAKNTAHPKSFAAKSIIIITCGDEFPMMVAGPQQPPLIMTFCSCWQSLPVRWLIPNSQRVRQSSHTILGWALPPERRSGCVGWGGWATGMALERQHFICGKATVFSQVSMLFLMWWSVTFGCKYVPSHCCLAFCLHFLSVRKWCNVSDTCTCSLCEQWKGNKS